MVTFKYTSRLSICPIRSKPSNGSEMVSQLLFGEEVELLQNKKGEWSQIKCLSDDAVGWVDSKQIVKLENDASQKSLVLDLVESVFADANSTLVTMGAELPDYDGMTCRINNAKYRYSGSAMKNEALRPNPENIEKVARRFLNVPYLVGGKSPFGIDSAGYIQLVFKCCGVSLPRFHTYQVEKGKTIDFMAMAIPGDVVFLTTETDQVNHVGIILSDNLIIHAYGYVRIDKIDHYGIYNSDISQYTHRLKIIKRFF